MYFLTIEKRMVNVMPTGYTADIYEDKDVSFEDFALNCARAFGAFAHLRDDPKAELSDEFKVDEYYVERFEEAKEELEKAKQMTDEDFAAEAEKIFAREKESLLRTIEEKKAIRKRYENMLEEVKQWVPPTNDHIELKNFMISQLEDSIQADGSADYYEEKLAELRCKTAEETRSQLMEDRIWDLNYSKEQLEKAEYAAKYRTEWVSQLRKSLTK